MIAMKKEPGIKVYYRTTPKLRGLHAKLQGDLRATEVISSRDGYTSNDAIINALLAWAGSQPPEELAAILKPYVDRFSATWDALLKGEKDPEAVAPTVPHTKVFSSEAAKEGKGKRA